jgi:hypothetical protein
MRERLSDRIHIALPAEERHSSYSLHVASANGRPVGIPRSPRRAPMTANQARSLRPKPTATEAPGSSRTVYRGGKSRTPQVIPGQRAGRITVTLDDTDRGSEVEVVYELTSLSEAGAHHLTQFAEGYTEYLRSWQDAIAACLEKRLES